MYVFVCHDDPDSIFTAIYDAWASRLGHKNIRILAKEPENYELFCEYIHVTTNAEKSRKVADTIRRRLGAAASLVLFQAIMADESDIAGSGRRSSSSSFSITKADALYRTLLLAFSMEYPDRVLECLGNPYVLYLFELSRSVQNEAHHLLGFLRFKELRSGILFSEIHPKNDVLPILGEHFCDRLPQENFMIYDGTRKLALIHRAGSFDFLIADASALDQNLIQNYSDSELEYQKLWCGFFESITIEARKNPSLQNQNIPKRFQKDTVEFQN